MPPDASKISATIEPGKAPPPRGWRAVLRIVTGVGLVLIGIAGIILPIMPGWVFLIPGLLMLGDYFPPAKRLVDWAKAKYESARKAAADMRSNGAS